MLATLLYVLLYVIDIWIDKKSLFLDINLQET